jgi:HAD superfamily hydrolase (TIGR01509 family)
MIVERSVARRGRRLRRRTGAGERRRDEKGASRSHPESLYPRYDGDVRALAAVIFDFDGIVLDSETPEYESHRRIFERCGAELTIEEWHADIGTWHDEQERRWHAALCARAAGAPDWPAYEAEKRRAFEDMLSLEPMPGIRRLLRELRFAGIPTAVASTAPARWVLPAADRIGVRDHFATIVTADDVRRRKPAPDVYLEAARRLGVDPRRAVAIEDSAPGLTAASDAGLKTVAIPHWLTERHDLSGADLRVESAAQVTLQMLEGLVSEKR